jgi:putative FmdB family regulatory protein
MPIYDFRCADCGALSEVLVRGAEARGVQCPDCGSEKMERLVSASYIIKTEQGEPGTTCCGRTERCETSPCSTGGTCRRA